MFQGRKKIMEKIKHGGKILIFCACVEAKMRFFMMGDGGGRRMTENEFAMLQKGISFCLSVFSGCHYS
jgi:hypothetical protein